MFLAHIFIVKFVNSWKKINNSQYKTLKGIKYQFIQPGPPTCYNCLILIASE